MSLRANPREARTARPSPGETAVYPRRPPRPAKLRIGGVDVTVVADPEWVELAGSAGQPVRAVAHVSLHDLKDCAAAVIRTEGAWDRIRAWRSVGVGIGVVVVVDEEEAPEDRPRLEPLVLLRRTDRDGLAEALDRLKVGESRTRVPLATGVADFHRGRFEPPGVAPIRLTGLEVRLLAYLASRSFRVVGRQELQEQVWGYRTTLETRTVEMTIARLRKKIGAESVLTVRGEGYRAVRVEPATAGPDQVLEAFRRGATLMLQHGLPDQAAAMLDHHARTRVPSDWREEAEERVLRARLLWTTGDLAGAEAAGRRGLELSRAHGPAWLEASAACALAPILRVTGRRDEALALVSSALGLFDALDDDGGRARALALHADFEHGEASRRLAEQALAAWERGRAAIDDGLSAQPLHAALLMRVAGGRWLTGRTEEAIRLYERAADLYELLGNHDQRAQAWLGIASIAFDRGDDRLCRARSDQASESLAHTRARRTRAHAEAFGAVVELVCGSPARARVRADLAAELVGAGPGCEESAYQDLVGAAVRLATGDPAGARRLVQNVRLPRNGWPALPYVAAWLRVASAETEDEREAALAQVPPGSPASGARFVDWLAAAAERTEVKQTA